MERKKFIQVLPLPLILNIEKKSNNDHYDEDKDDDDEK